MTHAQAVELAVNMAPDTEHDEFRLLGDRWIAQYIHDWHGKTDENCDIRIVLFRYDPHRTTLHDYHIPQTEGEQS